MDKKKITKKQKTGMLIAVIIIAVICCIISCFLENKANEIKEKKVEATTENVMQTTTNPIIETASVNEQTETVEEVSKITVTRAYAETEETQALPDINLDNAGLDDATCKEIKNYIAETVNGYGYQNAEKIIFMEKEETEEKYTIYFEIRLKDEESKILEITYDIATKSCEAVIW